MRDSQFESELLNWKKLVSHLNESLGSPFQSRFHILRLSFPLEILECEDCRPELRGEYCYCVFANPRGLRYTRLSGREVDLAEKIKADTPLSLEEKSLALVLIRKLAV